MMIKCYCSCIGSPGGYPRFLRTEEMQHCPCGAPLIAERSIPLPLAPQVPAPVLCMLYGLCAWGEWCNEACAMPEQPLWAFGPRMGLLDFGSQPIQRKSRQTLAMLPPVLTSTAEQTASNVLSATGALLIFLWVSFDG